MTLLLDSQVAIKHRLGKFPVGPALFRDRMLAAGTELLAVSDTHAIETAALPRRHDDPIDRLLITRARAENCAPFPRTRPGGIANSISQPSDG